MKRSITYPWRVQGANFYRNSFNRFVTMGQAKKARETAMLLLPQLSRPVLDLDGIDNRFVVALTRIASSYVDDDNLEGGDFKHIRDATAAFIGLDDRDRRVEFHYLQQAAPRGTWAVRIEIDCDEPGSSEERILGGVPDRLGAPKSRVCRGDKNDAPKPDRKQAKMVYLRCAALLPWEQSGGPIFTELSTLKGLNPPPAICVHAPTSALAAGPWKAGQRVTLWRHSERHEELGGRAWIYRIEKPKQEGDEARA